jgi:transposase InsO family protein
VTIEDAAAEDEKATITLAAGLPVSLPNGDQAFVHSWRYGWVHLVDAHGKPLPMRSLKSVARLLMSPEAHPPSPIPIPGLLERLSPKALARLKSDEALVRLVEVGLREDQADDETPPDSLNPALVPDEQHRISNLAAMMAPRWGIEYKSARVRITRILHRRAKGLAGMVDGRYVTARTDRQHPLMSHWVQQYLVARQYEATLHTSTIYLAFRTWMTLNQPDVPVPPERTFNRLAGEVYKKFPHYRAKAKTKQAIARAPKQSDAPRIAERPGELWLIDTTTANVEVRDPDSRPGKSRVFRCDVTKIIDAYSRYVVGGSIAETITGHGAVLALADAFASMVDDRETVRVGGRQYPRPFVGLPRALSRYPIPPRRLLTDNGRPFLGHEFVWQLERLKIELEPARVRDPRAKGRIERHFGTRSTGFEETQLGFVGGSINERGEESPDGHRLTWQQYFQRDEEWTDLYNFTEHRGLAAETGRRISPHQRWVEGSDMIGSWEVPRWENEWIRFLPSFEAKFTKYEVTRKGQVFNAPILEILLDTPKVAVDRRYRFHFNPSDLRQIYCFDPDGVAYEIPWIMRTEDTPQFGDFTRTQMTETYDGLTFDRKSYQDWMVMYLMRWMADDEVSASAGPLLSRNELMSGSAVSRLMSLDSVPPPSGSPLSLEASEAWLESSDEEDDFFDGDGDPFEAFG